MIFRILVNWLKDDLLFEDGFVCGSLACSFFVNTPRQRPSVDNFKRAD